MIQDVECQVTEELPTRLDEYDEALEALFALVKPQFGFSIKPDDSMPRTMIENALFDDQTQKDMLAIILRFQELTKEDASSQNVQSGRASEDRKEVVPAPSTREELFESGESDNDLGIKIFDGNPRVVQDATLTHDLVESTLAPATGQGLSKRKDADEQTSDDDVGFTLWD
jgi:hypothetical protein